MKTYRVFVQDRGRGLYSGFCDILAESPSSAVTKARGKQQLPRLHAVEWPPTDAGNRWIDQNVNRR